MGTRKKNVPTVFCGNMGTLEWEHSRGNMGTQFFLANLSSLKFEKDICFFSRCVNFVGNVHFLISRSEMLSRLKFVAYRCSLSLGTVQRETYFQLVLTDYSLRYII